jgi:hypothetical protein
VSKLQSYKRNSYAKARQHLPPCRCESKKRETKAQKAKTRENDQTGMTREIREEAIAIRSADTHHVE